MTDKQLFTHVLGWLDERECPELYAAVRERLGKPEQEPVASCIRSLTDHCASLVRERDEMQKQVWRYEKHGVTCQTYGHKVDSSCAECNVHENYAAPPAAQRQPLTDEEIDLISDSKPIWSFIGFARAIEQAHGIG